MLVYVRHGKTALNEAGDKERLRGWLPVPLSPEGRDQADQTGDVLAGSAIQPASFTTSDLPRAIQTAQIIGQKIGMPATPDAHIRDWNTGDFAGQLVSDALPKIQALIKLPYQPAPNGEAIQTYLDRFVPAMRTLVESPDTHLVVGHARGAAVLEGIASPVGGRGKDVDPAYLQNRPNVQPGGLLMIAPDWSVKVQNLSETPAGMAKDG